MFCPTLGLWTGGSKTLRLSVQESTDDCGKNPYISTNLSTLIYTEKLPRRGIFGKINYRTKPGNFKPDDKGTVRRLLSLLVVRHDYFRKTITRESELKA